MASPNLKEKCIFLWPKFVAQPPVYSSVYLYPELHYKLVAYLS